MKIENLRKEYHQRICQDIVRIRKDSGTGIEYPNFADGKNKSSIKIAWEIVEHLGGALQPGSIGEQTVGILFEVVTKEFLEKAFTLLTHLRPGRWHYSTTQTTISGFDQYEHLAYLDEVIRRDKGLSSAFGGDYIVKPDIVIGRYAVPDSEINLSERVLDSKNAIATLTPLRESNYQGKRLLLHASVSCKWTIRSDRSQNTRTEALNLIRNRKGHLPHIVAVTAEPLPTRVSSLALGTGDLDCVYHFALPELRSAVEDIRNEDQLDILIMMIEGRRLRDISDLPFDLVA